jgi:hypothetical protein
VDLVRAYADLRQERMAEILAQSGDIPSFFGAIDFLSDERSKWTLELMALTIRFAGAVHHRVKHALNCLRPMLLSPRLQPMIQTLRHGTLPSGHATEAFAVATVMTHLLAEADGDGTRFRDRSAEAASNMTQHYRLAARIAINRTVSGLHYPIDSAAGAVLGTTLGDYLVARCAGKEETPFRRFNGTRYHVPAGEKDYRKLVGADFQARTAGRLLKEGEAEGTQPLVVEGPVEGKFAKVHTEDRHLRAVWDQAKQEMTLRWGRVDWPPAAIAKQAAE